MFDIEKWEIIRKYRQAYVDIDTTVIPPYSPEILRKNEELKRINRLCYIMYSYFNYKLWGSPYRWYLENIPLHCFYADHYIEEMLKDFEELNLLGIEIDFYNPFRFLWDDFNINVLNKNIDDPKFIEENLSKIKKQVLSKSDRACSVIGGFKFYIIISSLSLR